MISPTKLVLRTLTQVRVWEDEIVREFPVPVTEMPVPALREVMSLSAFVSPVFVIVREFPVTAIEMPAPAVKEVISSAALVSPVFEITLPLMDIPVPAVYAGHAVRQSAPMHSELV